MVTRGSYCLCIKIYDTTKTRIGALGDIIFESGYYIYVGSALNSMIPRLQRHVKTSNRQSHKTHWHIDYLLKQLPVHIDRIFTISSAERLECILSDMISKHGEAVLRFGCSDCKCKSHLYMVKEFDFLKNMGLEEVSLETLSTIS